MSCHTSQLVLTSLETLNLEKAMRHSSLDHHVVGLDYLNLHRSDNFTMKLYLIEKETNERNGYLINPHSHRYEFNTTVLAGGVQNILFEDNPAHKSDPESLVWTRNVFEAETDTYHKAGNAFLRPVSSHFFGVGDSYYVNTKEIHTLQTGAGPTLLFLSQYADITDTSRLYLKNGVKKTANTGRRPDMFQIAALRDRCIQVLTEAMNNG